jgi:hypothetical protein
MSGNAWQSQTRVNARDRGRIGVTDSACFHPNPNLIRSMLGNWSFHHSKYAGCGDFHCFVCVSHVNLLCLSNLFAMLVRCSFRNMQRGHSNGCASSDSIYGIFETLRITQMLQLGCRRM